VSGAQFGRFLEEARQFKPNDFGVYDIHGNVWEWCDDFYEKYSAPPEEWNAFQTKNQGEGRQVLRGGSWGLPPVACRSANRYLVGAGPSRYGAAGFRDMAMP
jgi:formylglycine-generating enzyme required for sulfatase activity